ncbi:hypothetical protein BZA05DRAFT_405842 [Tricharina praecox]|uniref:uncharacterized protein n=1 Tax=Tricharina praecox TaxID=43433 RepID=UPI00221F58F3|nr:uncharacterized protein BZA05DRAFT_405842 [Tricharina praecox]KAI5846910.1 hypothetical protein BZA05DRAFT_405842 [Tricharina praecox]
MARRNAANDCPIGHMLIRGRRRRRSAIEAVIMRTAIIAIGGDARALRMMPRRARRPVQRKRRAIRTARPRLVLNASGLRRPTVEAPAAAARTARRLLAPNASGPRRLTVKALAATSAPRTHPTTQQRRRVTKKKRLVVCIFPFGQELRRFADLLLDTST